MSYTNVFGGTTLYPSDVSYLAVALSADISLDWPLEGADTTYPAARVIDVTASGAHAVILPDATLTGPGQTILFNCLSASTTGFLLKDFAGNTIATIGIGEQWQVYLAGTSTAAGSWRVFRYGASTATVQASALAGYGLTVTGGNLSQSLPLTSFNSSPRTALLTDRASIMLWNGTGSGTLVLPAAATAGNNFFISAHNAGGGDLTIDPAGTELIDGGATITLHPGDSATFVTDGLAWYTLGLGQQAVFAFDYTSITVTGGTYTLTGSELNRIAYNFVGTLTSNVDIVVPATVQQYWVSNATTGPFNLYLKTAAGSRVVVAQGARGIYYCNGVNVVDADTSTISLPVNPTDGGTGITSYTAGDLLYASGPTTLSKLAGTAVGNVLLTGGVGTPPSYGKVGLATHVSGTLPVANGGTGVVTTPANGQLLIGNGTGFSLATITPGSGVSITNSAGGITISATGAGGTVTSVNASGSTTGLTFSGGPITGSGTLTLGGTLVIGNGGTGATTAAGARAALDVPSTTGSGASGTWGINVSGNAATATTGSFSGNVGIGTGTPLTRFQVSASAAKNAPTPGSVTNVPAWITNDDPSYGLAIGSSADGHVWLQSQRSDASASVYNITLNEGGGNVGIGNATPSYKLDVGSFASGTGNTIRVQSAGDSDLRLREANDSYGFTIRNVGASGLSILRHSNDATGVSAMYIGRDTGNVGIGTTSPVRKFVVQDNFAYIGLNTPSTTSKRTGIAFSQNGTDQYEMGIDIGNSNVRNWYIYDSVASTARVLVDSSGNVGIGTTSPSGVLEVRKDQNASTQVWINNGSTGASSVSQLVLSTGTPNSLASIAVLNGNYRAISNGSGITLAYDDSDTHQFRTNAGALKLQLDGSGNVTSANQAAAVGYKGLPVSATSGAYTLVLTDMGKLVSANGTVTVPLNSTAAFPLGTVLTVFNYAGSAINVAPAGGASLTLAGTTTAGTRTLAQNALATLVKVGTDAWLIVGPGVS